MNLTDIMTIPEGEPGTYTATNLLTDVPLSKDHTNLPFTTTEEDYAIGWSSDQQSLENQLSIRIIYGGISVLGIVGNFLVMFTVYRVEKMRTQTNAFIVSLAACDFISSVFLIPLHLGIEIPIPPGVGGSVMCGVLLSKWPLWTSFTASVLNLACVTLERYFSICYPLRYNMLFTKRKIKLMIIGVWVAGIIMNSYMFYVFKFNGKGCYIDWYTVGFQRFLGVCNFSVIYAIPLVTMAICYILIMNNLSKSAKSLSRSAGKESQASLELLNARKKVIKMLSIVVITFTICWAPNQLLFFAYNCGFDLDYTSWYYHFSVLIAFCNSCMNPMIYGFKSKSYRRALKIAICGRNWVGPAEEDTALTFDA